MREHLYRGKRTEDGEWVHGQYVSWCNRHCVVPEDCIGSMDKYIVDPETVGEYTGLLDKKGTRIFEGDIVKSHYANVEKADFIETVVFKNGKFMGEGRIGETGKMRAPLPDGIPHLEPPWVKQKPFYMESCEVIGNVHDAPELLEVPE